MSHRRGTTLSTKDGFVELAGRLGGLAAVALLAAVPRVRADAPDAGAGRGAAARLEEAGAQIEALEKETGGRIGLFAEDTATGRKLEHRAGERFAMCSTFKWLLCARVHTLAEAGGEEQISLTEMLHFGEKDLLGYAPVSKERLKEGALSVQAACDAAVELSDNTAANLLLARSGGPAGLTAWLRRLGDPDTRLDRSEPELNENRPGDPRDTTTPAAMGADLKRFVASGGLPAAAQRRLLRELLGCQTGGERLRAGLPGWKVADKTGTGDGGAVNDVAVAWPPDQAAPLVIAVYLDGSTKKTEELAAVQARLARIAAEALRPGARAGAR